MAFEDLNQTQSKKILPSEKMRESQPEVMIWLNLVDCNLQSPILPEPSGATMSGVLHPVNICV
jgi:hypothetical protein